MTMARSTSKAKPLFFEKLENHTIMMNIDLNASSPKKVLVPQNIQYAGKPPM
jgi:hypothetical protein